MIIASLTPGVSHIKTIIKHADIDQFRFNTFLPISVKKKKLIQSLKKMCGEKILWIDLKTRQLRVVNALMYPYPRIKISHTISVELPTKLFFKDSQATIINIEGNDTLILSNRPSVPIEPGEQINIIDPSLQVKGYLTDNDMEYIKAAKKYDIHSYMLSFVEHEDDIRELIGEDPQATIIAKIESRRGLDFVKKSFPISFQRIHLMAARNDLFVHMEGNKTEILTALRIIIKKDHDAIAASGIFSSLEKEYHVSITDLSDLLLLKILGYKNFLLSEKLCNRKDSFTQAMKLWKAFLAQVKKHEESMTEHI